MPDETFIPYMIMMGTYGMILPGPNGTRMYYSPDPNGYQNLPENSSIQVIGGDAIIDSFDGEDALIDDDGNGYLRE